MDAEGAAASEHAVDRDAAAVDLGDVLDDRETEAGPAEVAAAGLVVHRDHPAVGRLQGDLAAVALQAAGDRARHAVDHVDRLARRRRMRIERRPRTLDRLGQEVVERRQDVARRGVVAAARTLRTPSRGSGEQSRGVTTVAISGAVVVEGVDVALVGLMAFDAADALASVRAALPVVDDPRRACRGTRRSACELAGIDDVRPRPARLRLACAPLPSTARRSARQRNKPPRTPMMNCLVSRVMFAPATSIAARQCSTTASHTVRPMISKHADNADPDAGLLAPRVLANGRRR